MFNDDSTFEYPDDFLYRKVINGYHHNSRDHYNGSGNVDHHYNNTTQVKSVLDYLEVLFFRSNFLLLSFGYLHTQENHGTHDQVDYP